MWYTADNSFREFEKGKTYLIQEKQKFYCYAKAGFCKPFHYSKEDITFSLIPIRHVTKTEVIKYLQGEISTEEITGHTLPNNGFVCDEKYELTLKDLIIAANNCLAKNKSDTIEDVSALAGFKGECITRFGKNEDLLPILSDANFEKEEYQVYIYYYTFEGYLAQTNDKNEFIKIFNELKAAKARFDSGNKKPPLPLQRNAFINILAGSHDSNNIKKENVPAINKMLDLEIANNNYDAILVRAYWDYEGTPWSIPNYVEAEKLLWQLTQKPDAYAYNTLGYLYCYHNPSGQPNYDKAFQCFLLAALDNVDEANYKVADLLMNGQGVTTNKKYAKAIFDTLYPQYKKRWLQADYLCKFADIAIRKGRCALEGIDGFVDEDLAKAYFLEAKYAIRQRELHGNGYIGDASVTKSIMNSLKKCPSDEVFEGQNAYLIADQLDVDFTLNQFFIGNEFCNIHEVDGNQHEIVVYEIRPEKIDKSLTLTTYIHSGFSEERINSFFTIEYEKGQKISILGKQKVDRFSYSPAIQESGPLSHNILSAYYQNKCLFTVSIKKLIILFNKPYKTPDC